MFRTAKYILLFCSLWGGVGVWQQSVAASHNPVGDPQVRTELKQTLDDFFREHRAWEQDLSEMLINTNEAAESLTEVSDDADVQESLKNTNDALSELLNSELKITQQPFSFSEWLASFFTDTANIKNQIAGLDEVLVDKRPPLIRVENANLETELQKVNDLMTQTSLLLEAHRARLNILMDDLNRLVARLQNRPSIDDQVPRRELDAIIIAIVESSNAKQAEHIERIKEEIIEKQKVLIEVALDERVEEIKNATITQHLEDAPHADKEQRISGYKQNFLGFAAGDEMPNTKGSNLELQVSFKYLIATKTLKNKENSLFKFYIGYTQLLDLFERLESPSAPPLLLSAGSNSIRIFTHEEESPGFGIFTEVSPELIFGFENLIQEHDFWFNIGYFITEQVAGPSQEVRPQSGVRVSSIPIEYTEAASLSRSTGYLEVGFEFDLPSFRRATNSLSYTYKEYTAKEITDNRVSIRGEERSTTDITPKDESSLGSYLGNKLAWSLDMSSLDTKGACKTPNTMKYLPESKLHLGLSYETGNLGGGAAPFKYNSLGFTLICSVGYFSYSNGYGNSYANFTNTPIATK